MTHPRSFESIKEAIRQPGIEEIHQNPIAMATHTNDETLLAIHSPQLAKHFIREMDRLWDTAELEITPHLRRNLERHNIR